MFYNNRIELIPIKPIGKLKGIFEGIDTNTIRDDDRISSIKSDNFDYTEWRKGLWQGNTIEEIHKMATEFEKRKKPNNA